MSDSGPLAKALRDFQFSLVGPSVDDDIRRAILRYGAAAVKASVNEQTKVRRGRKPLGDWKELHHVIEADAREWLAGGNPFKSRTDYRIAKDFAKLHPGHDPVSTFERIKRKLREKPFNRRWHMLAMAERISYDGYPYEAHIRVLEEQGNAAGSKDIGGTMKAVAVRRLRQTLDDYERMTGQPAPTNLCMKDVEETVKNALFAPKVPPKPTGLLELALIPSSPDER